MDGMSYVDVIILRHLQARPAHGYELRKRVEATTGFILHNNSLYPALRRFEEAGAVVKTPVNQEGGRPPRHVYEITDVGRELLHDLLVELSPDQAGDEMEFLSRLGQFSLLDPDERRTVLDARDIAVAKQLDHLRGIAAIAHDEYWGDAVTQELIRRCEQERSWLAALRDEAARPARDAP